MLTGHCTAFYERLVPKVGASRSIAVPDNGLLPERTCRDLEEMRRGLGLSQVVFAGKYLGLSQGSYSNILRGHDPAGEAVMSAVKSLPGWPPPQRQLALGVTGSD